MTKRQCTLHNLRCPTRHLPMNRQPPPFSIGQSQCLFMERQNNLATRIAHLDQCLPVLWLKAATNRHVLVNWISTARNDDDASVVIVVPYLAACCTSKLCRRAH